VALLEALVDRRAPTRLLIGSLLLGFGGLGVLAAPRIAAGSPADALAVIALLAGSLSWSVGALLQSRRPVQISPIASAAHQHLYGGGAMLLVALAVSEPIPSPTAEAWIAWVCLVLFGSVVTFTAYVQALRRLPISVVSTHAYVNPLGAALLGWLVLHEEITLATVVGAALILMGVGGVFRARRPARGQD
jgi:drug/metabolite transporter (DMT)-like permease